MNMDNNRLDNNISGAVSGLEFEIGSPLGESGLDFDSSIDIVVGEPNTELQLEVDGEFSVPDSFDSEEYNSSHSFIDGLVDGNPTYVPRFTEVSENFNKSYVPPVREKKENKPEYDIDPTAELDENTGIDAVVIASQKCGGDAFSDEKITILKFDDAKEKVEDLDPEEQLIKKLEEEVYLANNSREEKGEESCEPLESEPEEELRPEPPKEAAVLADPSLDAVFVDYAPNGGDAELISDEEAPLTAVDDGGKFGEYTAHSQKDEIKDRFLDSLTSVTVRLIAASVLFVAMLAVNVLSLLGVDFLAAIGLGDVSFAPAVLDLQFSVCMILFAVPELARAIKNLIHKVIAPELILLPSLAAIIIHTLVVAVSVESDYATFGLLFGIQVITTILAARHRISAEFVSFKIISRPGVKNILDKRLTRSLPRENLALDGAVDEYRSKTARMFRAGFISDFFRRTSCGNENSFNVILMTVVGLGAGLITGVVSYFIGEGSLVDATASFALVFLLSFPAFSILLHKLPYERAAKEAEAEDSTFVGEGSLYASSDIDVIAYDDTEIFGEEDVSIKKVHLYGKAYNATRAMSEMYSLFSLVGGPLCRLFSSAVDNKGAHAENIVIEDDGISGMLGDREVLAGTKAFMLRHGALIPEDDYKTDIQAYDATRVMYGASEGEVYVKFFVRYSFSEEFTMALPSLKAEKIVPLIYTRDPNITLDLVKTLTAHEDVIRVMKKHIPRSREDAVYTRVSAGIVTLGDKLNAINMVLLSKRYIAFQSSHAASELISMLAGTVLGAVFALTGALGATVMALSTLQLGLAGYLYIRSGLSFRPKK